MSAPCCWQFAGYNASTPKMSHRKSWQSGFIRSRQIRSRNDCSLKKPGAATLEPRRIGNLDLVFRRTFWLAWTPARIKLKNITAQTHWYLLRQVAHVSVLRCRVRRTDVVERGDCLALYWCWRLLKWQLLAPSSTAAPVYIHQMNVGDMHVWICVYKCCF